MMIYTKHTHHLFLLILKTSPIYSTNSWIHLLHHLSIFLIPILLILPPSLTLLLISLLPLLLRYISIFYYHFFKYINKYHNSNFLNITITLSCTIRACLLIRQVCPTHELVSANTVISNMHLIWFYKLRKLKNKIW
jgi:uncharacterized membrane protein